MRFRPVILLVLLALALPVNALASDFRLRVEDLSVPDAPTGYGVVLTDDEVGDIMAGTPGWIQVILNPLNSNVTWNLTMGLSKPLYPNDGTSYLGAPAIGELFLQSFNITSTGAAKIRVTLEDTGYTGLGPSASHVLTSSVFGNFCVPDPNGPANPCTAPVSVQTSSWASSSNYAPDLGLDQSTPGTLSAIGDNTGTAVAPMTFTSTGDPSQEFSDSKYTSFEDSGPSYSMFTQLIVTFSGAGSVDFYQDLTMDANQQLVPEPGTLMLIGLGIAGAVARRRQLMSL